MNLSIKAIEKLDAEMQDHCICGKPELWEKWTNTKGSELVTLEFPLGELTNPRISGFLWAWKMQGKLKTRAIEPGDKFSAQGLEGKARIRHITLTSALLAYRELPAHRRHIWK